VRTAPAKIMVQARLRQGTAERTGWIPDGPVIREGNAVTLPPEPGWWIIAGLYARLPMEALRTDWRVGGL
jgi:hypothetical protein